MNYTNDNVNMVAPACECAKEPCLTETVLKIRAMSEDVFKTSARIGIHLFGKRAAFEEPACKSPECMEDDISEIGSFVGATYERLCAICKMLGC